MKPIWIMVLVAGVDCGIAGRFATDTAGRQTRKTVFSTHETDDTADGQEMGPRW